MKIYTKVNRLSWMAIREKIREESDVPITEPQTWALPSLCEIGYSDDEGRTGSVGWMDGPGWFREEGYKLVTPSHFIKQVVEAHPK